MAKIAHCNNMADQMVSDLTGISSAADDDLLYIVDVSDTTDDASGSSRKITRQQFLGVTGDVVGVGDTQTLTNKTLTSPIISTISNTGTLTLPISTDTLVGRATTDTLTNKTLTNPTLTTPTLGVATATSINKVTITAPATSATLTIANGASLITSGAYAVTLTATDTTGVTLPTTGTLATLAGSETLTNKTLTSPVLNTGVSGTAFLDEDDMASNSATKLASQQSIKAYVDASGSTTGWTASADTWTYASASTFTIAGIDRTAVYTKGTRLKFTQTTVKYAVVVSSAFSTNTTVTIAVNTDYTIANVCFIFK